MAAQRKSLFPEFLRGIRDPRQVNIAFEHNLNSALLAPHTTLRAHT